MSEIKEKIERFAEINCAEELIQLGEEIINEREEIYNFLLNMNIIKIDPKTCGFNFIDKNAEEYKKIYFDMYENF